MEGAVSSLQPNGGKVRALGGSGENGRNCFLLEAPAGNLLMDCGVKREITEDWRDAYPALTADVAKSLSAVFLSHSHEDHCAALPYLHALGYRGAIYASPETIEATPRMIHKWMAYAQSHGCSLPYGEADVAGLHFCPLQTGEGKMGPFSVLTGRSGHTVGSLWAALKWRAEGDPLFYSGDLCLCSHTLATDQPPRCGAAVLDAAYAGQALDQAGQYAALEAFVARAAARGGRVLLPVPSQGRGCDMLLYLAKRFPHLPVWAEDVLVRSCEALLRQSTWIRGDLEGRSALAQVKRVCTPADRAQACACAPCLCFTTDGMLTTAESRFYLEAFGSDPASCAVITGHAAQGTPAANLLTPGWCVENSIAMQTVKITIKVHADDEDVLSVCRRLGTRQVLLFHAPAACCAGLYEAIAHLGDS